MDPNEALRTLRRDVANLARYLDDDDVGTFARLGALETLASDVVTTFQGLDDWLSRGGFPPEAWREGPDAFGEADPRDDAARTLDQYGPPVVVEPVDE